MKNLTIAYMLFITAMGILFVGTYVMEYTEESETMYRTQSYKIIEEIGKKWPNVFDWMHTQLNIHNKQVTNNLEYTKSVFRKAGAMAIREELGMSVDISELNWFEPFGLAIWLNDRKALKPLYDDCIADGKITRSEYKHIKKEAGM